MRRIGKRIAFGMEDDLWLVLHLMIAGRLHWRAAGAKLAGRNQLAAFDFPNGSLVLTEAGSRRRASLHVLKGEKSLREIDPGDIEIFGSELCLITDGGSSTRNTPTTARQNIQHK